MNVTPEMWREFRESVIWFDLEEFLRECLEVNRDLLEGIKTFKEGFPQESDEMLRGRCSQIRDLIGYVMERSDA